MKQKILTFAMLLLAIAGTMVQSQNTEKSETVQYHFWVNSIPSEWNYPLIGCVNNVNGNHESIQLGIVNSTTGGFGGLQVGFLNTVANNVTGVQSGFINTTGGRFLGLQHGFINTTGHSVSGIQNGFINSVTESVTGIQNGFINSAGTLVGLQSGFINSAQSITGLQCGFINSANTLRGVQLGFINSVDKVEKGLPIGFLSFVKHGGYKAVELSVNSVCPVNITFKTGVRELYTYPVLAYDWRLTHDRLSFGYGIGSNLDLNQNLFINPELEWLHQVSLDFNHFTTFKCNFGYSLSNKIEFLAGPALVWQFKINADDFHHNYTEWNPSIISVNKITIGWNAALRYKF